MYRITVNLTQSLYKKIKSNAARRELSLSQYLNHLIDLGLQVEAVSINQAEGKTENKNAHKTEIANLGESKILWKHVLAYSLESRYILRHLTHILSRESGDTQDNFLEKVKKNAEIKVSDLLDY
jgi:hypothetical protein